MKNGMRKGIERAIWLVPILMSVWGCFTVFHTAVPKDYSHSLFFTVSYLLFIGAFFYLAFLLLFITLYVSIKFLRGSFSPTAEVQKVVSQDKKPIGRAVVTAFLGLCIGALLVVASLRFFPG